MLQIEKHNQFIQFVNGYLTAEDNSSYDILTDLNLLIKNHFDEIRSNEYQFEGNHTQYEKYKSGELSNMLEKINSIRETFIGYTTRSYIMPPLRELHLAKIYKGERLETRVEAELKFIEEQIKEIESNMDNNTNPMNSLVKLKWKGDQKQLAELFITLEQMGWIEPIMDGQKKSICKNICNLFDISHTKRNEKSNEVNSFTEIMKVNTDRTTKDRTYPKIFTQRYKKYFSKIDRMAD